MESDRKKVKGRPPVADEQIERIIRELINENANEEAKKIAEKTREILREAVRNWEQRKRDEPPNPPTAA